MADSYTPNLGLTLMENGTHENTWNDEYINNDERIDAKLGDVTTISSTGGTQVLTGTQERVNVVKMTGALVSNLTVEFSGIGGAWVIQNDTSGAFTVTCKKTGQTGITVDQGSRVLAYYNGTDIATLTAETAANLGLGAGDSPQFAGVNVGNAADTTVTRVSAGIIAVAGVTHNPPEVFLTSGSASGSSLDVVLTSYTGYRAFKILFTLVPATDNALLYLRLSTNAGVSYDAGASNYGNSALYNQGNNASAIFSAAGSGGTSGTDDTAIYLSPALGIDNAATGGISGEFTIWHPSETTKYPKITFQIAYIDDAGDDPFMGIGTGTRRAAQDTDAFRLLFSSGNISSGSYAVIGIR